jgi:hypothetical protein
MYHLIIDTCVWIDLGRKLTEVREKISDLVSREKARLIVPQIIIDEWNEHKQAKIVEARKASIRGKIKNARTISQYLEQDEADDLIRILDRFRGREDEIEALALEEVRAIEDLFNHPSTIILPVTEEAKLRAVDFALAKRSPFQSKNSMADALIMLSAVDYISQQNLSNCIFVSSNTTDFSSQSDKNQIHEDLEELFNEHGIGYFSNIGLAINEIEEELVSIESIRRIQEALQFAAVQEALERYRQMMEGFKPAIDLSALDAVQEAARVASEQYRQMIEGFRPAIDVSALEAMQETARAASEQYRQMMEGFKLAIDVSALEAMQETVRAASEQYYQMVEGFKLAIDLSAFDAVQEAARAASEQYYQMIEGFRPAIDVSALEAMQETVRAASEQYRQMMEGFKPAIDLSALEAIQETALAAAERNRQMMESVVSAIDLSALDAIQEVAQVTVEQYRWMMEGVKSAIDLSALDYAARMAAESHRQMMEAIGSTRDLYRIEDIEDGERKPSQPSPEEMPVKKAEVSFAVYVNYSTSAATIHSTACRYYRNRTADKTDNGHWKKPFSSLEDAQMYASSEGRSRSRCCKVCLADRQS